MQSCPKMSTSSVQAGIGFPRAPLGSPPPAYIRSPPLPTQRMVTTSQPFNKLQKAKQGRQGGGRRESYDVSSGGTVMGSETVLAVAHSGIDRSPEEASSAAGDKGNCKYERWYPGDASHSGRPAWWNRVLCCGYGMGCLLCPCGGLTCRHVT
ncbi:hypothetical protein CNH00713 [Cryptococcus deneoformans JEC21]|uniref:Uncharacterized protein n=1 Tax=Cryptococcus deneoformans (strain JEC21 / ATCC MYA-565) TaxID=214684 RepID=A0A0S2M668_CRYD1|nr:hypothetical protein CNH00713 [Cryptococcus neoformans var. neoformans JEC21]ALO69550.1 hypothetical protein CNH00713 [Cryptococcus neoformans var. neoformans JEC21]